MKNHKKPLKMKGFGLSETAYIKFLEEEEWNKKIKCVDFIWALDVEKWFVKD